jgi:hypothetical protein
MYHCLRSGAGNLVQNRSSESRGSAMGGQRVRSALALLPVCQHYPELVNIFERDRYAKAG